MRVARWLSSSSWRLAAALWLAACSTSSAPGPAQLVGGDPADAGTHVPTTGGAGEAAAGHAGAAGKAGAGGSAGSGGAGNDTVTTGFCAPDGNCEQRVTLPPAAHVIDPEYADKPPTGGPHNPCWASWGVHAQPLADQYWVHNLEHGGVVLLYHCPEGCADQLGQLQAFVAGHERTLLTESPELQHRFEVVAWGYRLAMDTLDVATLDAFYMMHFNHGPESISAGPPAGCP